MKDKLEVLVLVAKELNKRNIKWVLGASCMLYLRSIVSTFTDIDILFLEDSYDQVKEVMDHHGIRINTDENNLFKTKKFLEYHIQGVDLDLMAGLAIVNNTKEYYFPLAKDAQSDMVLIDHTEIYLDSIENWLYYYQLMNRLDKVKLILDSKNNT